MRPHFLLLACILLATASQAPAQSRRWSERELPRWRGIVLSHATETPDATGYGSPASLVVMDELLALHANAVTLTPIGIGTAPDSPFIESSATSAWSTNDERLARMIDAAHARDLAIVLAPRLELHQGNSRDIDMHDDHGWRTWFEEYTRWLLPYAELAEREGLDALIFGTALGKASLQRSECQDLIRTLRRSYRGPIGYAAGDLAELERVQFWGELDFVGLCAYEPLAEKPDASEQELLEGASAQLDRLVEVADGWRRPAIVTEVGYRSIAGCHVRPRGRGRGRADEAAQAAAYRAFLSAFAQRAGKELRGVFFTGFSSDPNPARRDAKESDSPRGKAAYEVLREAYLAGAPLLARTVPPLNPARGLGGIVVSSDSLATEVGLSILRRGGNAVDAAIATAFALAVSYPEAGNLGGGGFLLAQAPGERAWAIDFRDMAPRAADEDMYVAFERRGDPMASTIGARAAAIPGSVAGLYAAWQRAGSLPWANLVEPAQRLAAQGFAVGEKLPLDIESYRDRLLLSPMSRSLFFRSDRKHRDGMRPLRTGEHLLQPELARVLERIANEGERGFYRGATAQDLTEDVRAAGGVWDMEDLRHYRSRDLTPIELPLARGRSLLTLPPPSSGGVVLGQSLYFLQRLDGFDFEPASTERARAVVEALRLAFADRNAHLADPALMSVRAEELLRPSYLRRRAQMLPRFGVGRSDLVAAGDPARESRDTTHLIVFDASGACVSLTTTLNGLFGCGWASPRTGILLNNQMDDFDTRPGRPNTYGLVGTGVNRIRPGARMLSSMSPCIVVQDGAPWLALGGRGGPRILSGLLQVLLYRCWDDMSLADAIAAPRLHHQWLPDEVQIESDRVWPKLAEALDRLGYSVTTATERGRIHGAERLADGSFVGVSDPREHGLARAVQSR